MVRWDQAAALAPARPGDLARRAPAPRRDGPRRGRRHRQRALLGVRRHRRRCVRARAGRRFAPGVPLLRGLVRLCASLSPLFRGRGVARRSERSRRRDRRAAALVPDRVESTRRRPLATVALLGWLCAADALPARRRAPCDRRARGAAPRARPGTARPPSRFSLRCGTNFAALVLPVAVLGERCGRCPRGSSPRVVGPLLALALTMELWQLVQVFPRLARVVLLPGLGLQRLTTREPRLDETRVALTALAAVLRRELSPA